MCPGRLIEHDGGWEECDTCTNPEAFHLVTFSCGLFGHCSACDGPSLGAINAR
jgi:hypothetical protein